MCSSHFFDIINILEDSFANDFLNGTFNNDFKFYKSSKDQRVADYICLASNRRQCALEASKHWESKCIEKFPWIKDYIEVTFAPHGFSISLNRKLNFLIGLQRATKAGRMYGYNSFYKGKGYYMSIIKRKSPGCLTNLRLEVVFEVIANILKACGGIPCSEADSNELLKISVTHKNVNGDSINILVGPVNTQTSDSNCTIDSDLYKRYRTDEITTMCEHKEDISDNIESKSKLLKSIIYFDLLQSNIWRSVTLHLLNKDSGENTSCKGSLFIMYNYARLHTLCEKFDENISCSIYSSLPPLEEIDFALLDKEEEWKIMFHCILCWPSVLRKSVINLETGRPKIHLIFDFLKTVSNVFSQYYHRIRIFTEPRPHLMPVLFARMHLLKTLLLVFDIALGLVGICPLNKMHEIHVTVQVLVR